MSCLSNTCQYSIEGVHTKCVLSNTHSVINTKHGPYKFTELKQEDQIKRLLSHLCPCDFPYNVYLQGTDSANNE